MLEIEIAEEIQANNNSKGSKSSSNAAKKALISLKNLIVRSACKLKIKNYLGKSGFGCNNSKKSPEKRACCACISSEKRTSLTNGLFKMKSFLLKGGNGDHAGGSKGSINNNGNKNGGGNDVKGAHDQKKQK
ncbi:hypothetical protein REPUB_Repub05bG0022900 [Reevesia pubescens]